jgi:hypothetical protein
VEAVFRPEVFGYFPVTFGRFQRESARKSRNSPEKSGDFPAAILLPRSVDLRCSPAGTGPYFSTWGCDQFIIIIFMINFIE